MNEREKAHKEEARMPHDSVRASVTERSLSLSVAGLERWFRSSGHPQVGVFRSIGAEQLLDFHLRGVLAG